jgi:uncharacterized Ntn-hydrolase superfamily protein
MISRSNRYECKKGDDMAPKINTFSIVAYDPAEDSWGVAVASKFLAVGSVVSWARAQVGAVATQSFCKVSYGPDGLALMEQGKSAQETLAILTGNDPQESLRQVGVVDRQGGAATHTGKDCFDWAGGVTAEGVACQGNILAGAAVIHDMLAAYQSAPGEMADRLVTALLAADAAGGDKRGKQGAAVLVVKPNGGYGGDNDRYLDLRVDDDPLPIPRLQKLVAAHHIFFGQAKPEDQIVISESIAREIQHWLIAQDYMGGEVSGQWDTASKQAFWALVGNENLEERWSLDKQTDMIDRVALEYLRERFTR